MPSGSHHSTFRQEIDEYWKFLFINLHHMLSFFVDAPFETLQSSSVSTLSNDVGSACDTWTYPFVQTKNKVCVSGATGAFKMCTVSNAPC